MVNQIIDAKLELQDLNLRLTGYKPVALARLS